MPAKFRIQSLYEDSDDEDSGAPLPPPSIASGPVPARLALGTPLAPIVQAPPRFHATPKTFSNGEKSKQEPNIKAEPIAEKQYPCSFHGCTETFRAVKTLRQHKINVHDYCAQCNLDFSSWDAYHEHKLASPEHLTCPVCSEDFATPGGRTLHIKRVHPKHQKLHCPACNQLFGTGQQVVQHMEKNACGKVKPALFNRVAMIHDALDRAGVSKSTSANADQSDNEVAKSIAQISIRDNNAFPTLPTSSSPSQRVKHKIIRPSQVRQSKEGGPVTEQPVKATDDAVTPRAWQGANRPESLQKPSGSSVQVKPDNDPADGLEKKERERIESLTRMILGEDAAIERKRNNDGRLYPIEVLDPFSPLFRADLFAIGPGRYRCPYASCRDQFSNRHAIVTHARTKTHSKREFICPSCYKRFGQVAGLVSHLEQPSRRCQIQASAYYDLTLAIASGGVLTSAGFHREGNVRLQIQAQKAQHKEREPVW